MYSVLCNQSICIVYRYVLRIDFVEGNPSTGSQYFLDVHVIELTDLVPCHREFPGEEKLRFRGTGDIANSSRYDDLNFTDNPDRRQ